MSFIRSNISLVVGLAIPVVMVVAMLLLIYVPQFLHHPTQSFVYADNNNNYNYYGSSRYIVSGNQIQQLPEPVAASGSAVYDKSPVSVLYFYDISKNQSRVLSLEDAKKLRLDPNTISSDGFSVTKGNRGDGGIFSLFGESYDYNAWYLSGHGVSRRINVQVPNYYYGFAFLGWVISQ